jgi:hypothetical protein
MNVGLFVGRAGPPFYYLVFVTLWILSFVLTHEFAIQALGVSLASPTRFLSATVGGLLWFSLQPSYQVLQYVASTQIGYHILLASSAPCSPYIPTTSWRATDFPSTSASFS